MYSIMKYEFQLGMKGKSLCPDLQYTENCQFCSFCLNIHESLGALGIANFCQRVVKDFFIGLMHYKPLKL